MQTVNSSDGTKIVYEQYGDGPPLLLIHGGSSPQFWEPIIPRFTQDYTVIVPHRRGVGASEDTESYTLNRGVDDVTSVIKAVDGEPVVFGHSFGGLLALEAARTAPVDTLVAYEPAVLPTPYRREADLASQMQTLLDDGDREEAMKHYIREVIHGGEIADLDAWLDSWPPWPEITALIENIVRINRAIEAYMLPERLPIDASTLLLTGTEGPTHLRDSVRAVHAAVPNSRLFEFDGLGHGGPSEAPDAVTKVVRAHSSGDPIPTAVRGELTRMHSQEAGVQQ